MFILGILLFLLCLYFVTLISTGYNVALALSIFDVPTLLAFALLIISVVVMTSDYKVFISGIRAAVSKKYQMTEEQREEAISLFSLLSKAVLYFSAILFLLGLMMILTQLSEPSALGPNISLAILSLYYGLIIVLAFFQPAIYILKRDRQKAI